MKVILTSLFLVSMTMFVEGHYSAIPSHCHQPKDPGSCSWNVQKYYYDPSVGNCLAFYYGGCGGNNNRFDSHLDCVKTCGSFQPVVHQSSSSELGHIIDKLFSWYFVFPWEWFRSNYDSYANLRFHSLKEQLKLEQEVKERFIHWFSVFPWDWILANASPYVRRHTFGSFSFNDFRGRIFNLSPDFHYRSDSSDSDDLRRREGESDDLRRREGESDDLRRRLGESDDEMLRRDGEFEEEEATHRYGSGRRFFGRRTGFGRRGRHFGHRSGDMGFGAMEGDENNSVVEETSNSSATDNSNLPSMQDENLFKLLQNSTDVDDSSMESNESQDEEDLEEEKDSKDKSSSKSD